MSGARDFVRGRWFVGRWPFLAWVETAFKSVAIVVGVLALIAAMDGTFALPRGLRLVQVIILGVLSAGLLAAIWDRLMDREAVAMVFVVLNNLGHWAMLGSLASSHGPGDSLLLFCGLMLAGDVVKVIFIRVHEFRVREISPTVLVGLTSIYAAGYAMVLALELFR